MCGIAGFWQRPADGEGILRARVRRMADSVRHRGPDDGGEWVDPSAGIALGFRRLSILDLSPLGHQPMTSGERRYTIVFNGEIYNFLDLKSELGDLGHKFAGGSDTEVMLAGFSQWGVPATLKRITGMFAIGVWDGIERTLTLARDRVGKKPLYFGRFGGTWLFASELKALRTHPDFTVEIDREALKQFLRFSYVPAPLSIYKGVEKLPPGHFVTIKDGDASAPVCYWNPQDVVRDGQRDQLMVHDVEAIDELDVLLRDAVARRMISDVPLGAFLSGGLDSSAVVALMQAQSSTSAKTFTIGFDVAGYDEAKAAKAVAAHLGTDHTELYVTPDQAQAVIPSLPCIYDEPFADSSQIPMYLVSRLARTDVTVALSGDGGDELFGGYNRYFWAPWIWNRARYLPTPVRRAICAGVLRTSPEHLDNFYSRVSRALPPSWAVTRPGDMLHKLAGVLDAPDQMELYRRLTSAWQDPASIVVDGESASDSDRPEYPDLSACERMMYWDLRTYLPDDVLVKVDRASMAVGLEVRAPLLDHRLIEWAWRLPEDLRVREGAGKWLLRQLVYRYIPRHLVDRPKAGFGVPIDHWLRGPLRGWAEELLTKEALEAGGLLKADPIRAVWAGHLRGHRNEHTRLWPVLMFQAWRQQWLR